jgi:hypothetical protein
VEEENQEAVVENHLVEAATQQNHLMQVLAHLSNAAVVPFQKNHLCMKVFHPFGVQTHLPFQVPHPHPLRCNVACHLE